MTPAVHRRSRKRRPRGVALVMVLGAIAVLAVMLTEFQEESSADLATALAERDALKAEYMARSAVNLSRLLIAAEPTFRKALAIFFLGRSPPQVPVWEFADRILGAFNDKEGEGEFARLAGVDMSSGKNLGLGGGRFDVAVADEDAKVNVNLAARGDAITQNRLAIELAALMAGDRYGPLFEQRDRDGQFSDRQIICSAIVDWADPDENLYPCDLRAAPGSAAAEDAFYQLLKQPYPRKNAAYDSLEELHLVRGVGEDFWATFVDPDPDKPAKRTVTVWGQGTVNVNTANAQTLLAIVCAAAKTATLCTDPNEAQKFIMGVTLIRGFTAGAPLFGAPGDFVKTMKGQGMFGPLLQALGIKPIVFDSESELGKMISTESKVFSIYADGIVPGYQRKTRVRIHAVVDFRDAPPPGMPLGMQLAPAVPGAPGALPGAATPSPAMAGLPGMPGVPGATGAAGGLGTEAIAGVLVPNPGGTVIYFRME